MNFDVIVTCAVTGAGDTTAKNPNVPVTPQEIADAAIEAAQAGAAVAHLHVRDPETGKGSRDVGLFKEAVDLVRASGTRCRHQSDCGHGRRLDPHPPTIPPCPDRART